MSHFYDRLEAQLADATERGVRRRGWPRRGVPAPRWRGDWLAGTAALAVTLIVVAVFIGLGDRGAGQRHLRPAGPAVVVNYGAHQLPPLGGATVCDTDLLPPAGDGSLRGVFVVHTRPPTRYAFSLTASGLSRPSGGYAVWLLPATRLSTGAYQLLSAQAPVFVGVIRPAVGPGGRLAVEGLLPQSASGAYLVRLTVQPRPSSATPGQTILQGFIGL